LEIHAEITVTNFSTESLVPHEIADSILSAFGGNPETDSCTVAIKGDVTSSGFAGMATDAEPVYDTTATTPDDAVNDGSPQ
jgi:hypothetical protein